MGGQRAVKVPIDYKVVTTATTDSYVKAEIATRSRPTEEDTVFDFGALPPEINSGRMYAGPGSEPMMVAAAAWDELAAELGTATSGYSSVISELTSAPWVGPASASMVSAVMPYVTWLSAVAAQAEQTASQARAAAAAYETAFVMTVPPPVIAANRVLLMTLIATNFFGQNTPAIAATEAQYMEMWAQDAAAMYGYAALVGDRLGVAPVHVTAEYHHPGRGGRPSRRGYPSHRHAGRQLRTDRRGARPHSWLCRRGASSAAAALVVGCGIVTRGRSPGLRTQ